ncbi:MAG: PfkB family carbohydrate kinase, partial [Chloroflexi bacterium]|nr:PfkB family carbohydrate kinase [Chloroflexota bacterium]
MTVVVLGGLNMDLIVETAVVAAPGETREGRYFSTTPGGKGGNQAVAAARFLAGRVAVEMVGLVGDDTFGVDLRTFMADAGVDVERVRVVAGEHSGVAVIMIDDAGENSVNAVYGANTRCGDAQLADVVAALAAEPAGAGPHVLLVQQETPLATTAAAMRAARARG